MTNVLFAQLGMMLVSLDSMMAASNKFTQFIEPALALKKELAGHADVFNEKINILDAKIREIYEFKTGKRAPERLLFDDAREVFDADEKAIIDARVDLSKQSVEIIRWIDIDRDDIDRQLTTGHVTGGMIVALLPLLHIPEVAK